MEKQFKPTLAKDVSRDIDYPRIASYKRDGIRGEFHPDKGLLYRSLNIVKNKQIQDKFKIITEFCKKNNMLIEGEFYAHNRTFQEITRALMTNDFNNDSVKKKILKEGVKDYDKYVSDLIGDIKFYSFDCIYDDLTDMSYIQRFDVLENNPDLDFYKVENIIVNSDSETNKVYGKAIKLDYEGIVLRSPNSPYIFGRSNTFLRKKEIKTFDAKIIDVLKEKKSMIASAFVVLYNNNKVKVSLSRLTREEKINIFLDKLNYIGNTIEYKGMIIGSKNVPRHPMFLRYRFDK